MIQTIHTHYQEEIKQIETQNLMISEGIKTALAMIQLDYPATVKQDIKRLAKSMRTSYGLNLTRISKLIKHRIINDGFRTYCQECGDNIASTT